MITLFEAIPVFTRQIASSEINVCYEFVSTWRILAQLPASFLYTSCQLCML